MEAEHFTPATYIHLAPQPSFPTEDLHPDNVRQFCAIVRRDPGVLSQAQVVEAFQQPLYMTAVQSLRAHQYPLPETRETYRGFTLGFTAIEALTLLLKGAKGYRTEIAVQQMNALMPKNPLPEPLSHHDRLRRLVLDAGLDWLDEGLEDDIEKTPYTPEREEDLTRQSKLAERHKEWPERLPHTFTMITNIAAHYDAHRRTGFRGGAVLGAQIATELQDPTIAA